MTQRDMHLSPAAADAAIRLLDQPSPVCAMAEERGPAAIRAG